MRLREREEMSADGGAVEDEVGRLWKTSCRRGCSLLTGLQTASWGWERDKVTTDRGAGAVQSSACVALDVDVPAHDLDRVVRVVVEVVVVAAVVAAVAKGKASQALWGHSFSRRCK